MAFPTTPLDFVVELALGADLSANPSTWTWTATPPAGMPGHVRSDAGGVTIMRGGRDGAIQSPPSTFTLLVDNSDGRWTPSNPLGVWYGRIGLNTPIRIRTNEGSSSVRATLFLSSLPPRWYPGMVAPYVPIIATGIMQRLQRGNTPLRSPLVRSIAAINPVAYWPGEDASGSTSIASYFSGHRPMVLSGTSETSLTFASDGPGGSAPLPEFTNVAGVSGVVPAYEPTGEWTVASVFKFPAAPTASTVLMRWYTSGTYPMWHVILTDASPDTLTLKAFDASGVEQISDSMNFAIGVSTQPYDQFLTLAVDAKQNGANVDYKMRLYDADGGSGTSVLTENNITVGNVTRILVPASALTNGMHAGHWVAVDSADDLAFFIAVSAIEGYDGLPVASHVESLANLPPIDGAPFQFVSDNDNTMGPQPIATVLDVLRQCETVTSGRLVEAKDPTVHDRYLLFYSINELVNFPVDLTIDQAVGQLAEIAPTNDELYVRNDVTATRLTGTGSSGRVVATPGEYTSLNPTENLSPSKVGTYNDSGAVNVDTDDALIDQAGWRVNLGTHPGLRYPSVVLDLAANPSLIPAWLACDIGFHVRITNPPAGVSTEAIDLLVEGYTEYIDALTWTVTLFCSPYKPYHVIQMAEDAGDSDEFLGRATGDPRCALRASLTSTATGATNFDPNFYRWTVAADDFPLDIRMGGEVITLSGISTSAASFVAAGAASHADNAAVTPAMYAGAGVRQLICVLAAIRSSGTGSLVTPAGYTRSKKAFPESSNVQLYLKVHTGSESDPTITPSGGAAGDTVSAFTFGWTIVPSTLGTAPGTSLDDIVLDALPMLNASAQNIAYGGLLAWQWQGNVNLLLGWKQDDYTSIAVPAGWTEILEASSTTGNDQGLYAAYRIDTTPVLTPEGSLAVTGGASAISRSSVLALAGGIQVMTISARSVNGVVKAHEAGTLIEVEDPGVLSL